MPLQKINDPTLIKKRAKAVKASPAPVVEPVIEDSSDDEPIVISSKDMKKAAGKTSGVDEAYIADLITKKQAELEAKNLEREKALSDKLAAQEARLDKLQAKNKKLKELMLAEAIISKKEARANSVIKQTKPVSTEVIKSIVQPVGDQKKYSVLKF